MAATEETKFTIQFIDDCDALLKKKEGREGDTRCYAMLFGRRDLQQCSANTAQGRGEDRAPRNELWLKHSPKLSNGLSMFTVLSIREKD